MKVVLMCALLCSALSSAASFEVLHKRGQFEKAGQYVSVEWDIECPVVIEGWSVQDLKRLWGVLDDLAFSNDVLDKLGKKEKVFDVNDLLDRLAEKRTGYDLEKGVCGNALEVIANIRVPHANKDWVAVDLTGYDNEGGNGCHSLGVLCVLARKDLKPMPLKWFAKDVPGLQREVVRHLRETLRQQDGDEKDPFADGMGEVREEEVKQAERVAPDFIPTHNGIRFRYKAYEILAGCYGMPEVTVPWSALKPFCDVKRLEVLRKLTSARPEP